MLGKSQQGLCGAPASKTGSWSTCNALVLPFLSALVCNWKYLCGAPVSSSVPLGPPPDGAAETGFALAPLPALTAAGHPDCKLAEKALIRGSSLSSFTLHFPGSASTTEISRNQGGYCCQENACFNNSSFKTPAVPVAAPQVSPKNYCWKLFSSKLTFQADLEFKGVFESSTYIVAGNKGSAAAGCQQGVEGGRVLFAQPDTGSCNAEMPSTEPGTLAAVRRGERLPLPGHNSSSPKAGVSNWSGELDLKKSSFLPQHRNAVDTRLR